MCIVLFSKRKLCVSLVSFIIYHSFILSLKHVKLAKYLGKVIDLSIFKSDYDVFTSFEAAIV